MTEINRFERAVHQAEQATSTGGATVTKEEAARILAGAADPTSRNEAEQALRSAGFADIAAAAGMVDQVSRQDADTLARHGYSIGEGGHTNLQEAIRAQQRATNPGRDQAVTGIMDERTRAIMRSTEGQQTGMLRELGFDSVAAFQRDYNQGRPADQQLPADGSIGPNTRSAIHEEHRITSEVKTIRYGQANLQGLGYDIGTTGVDGRNGPNTHAAVETFQRDNGIEPVTGIFDEDTRTLLGKKVGDAQRTLETAGQDLGRHGVDGRFGPDTRDAVTAFQTAWNQAHPDNALPTDGVLRPATLEAIGTTPVGTSTTTTTTTQPDPTSNDPTVRRDADRAVVFDPRTPLERTNLRLGDHEPGWLAKVWDFVKEFFTLTLIDTRTWNDALTEEETSELEARGTRLAATDGFIAFYQIPGDQPGNFDRAQLQRDIEGALKRANPGLEPEEVERRAAIMMRSTITAAETRVREMQANPGG